MKTTTRVLSGLFCVITFACSQPDNVQPPFDKIEPLQEVYQPVTLAEVKPEGWIKKQIRENLDGFVGRLDTLVPKLTMEDKIYGENRLSEKVKSKDVGALGEAGDWQVQFLWWNSETQSNWRDGYIRSAILLQDQEHLAKLKLYVDYILATQDEDGYLGIYDKDLRYKFDNENGELWAKATLLRGLLAWYEYSNDQKVLSAIERAIQNVMDNYSAGTSHPFYSKQPNVGGTSHGLAITDVFEALYRITGKPAYRDYCLFLYQDFSEQELNESAQYKKLVNDTLLLSTHGVHVYEHLRSVTAAYYASGNPELKHALDHFLEKIALETTASGAGVGDEWIGGRKADATKRGYEYCSMHELMHSYAELVRKTGDRTFADKAEKIFLNAAQGARHPSESCVAYLKSDNSYYMTGGLNGDTSDKNQTRYSYSPVHQEAAVCCVPMAGRIAPYYVQYMWMKNDHALVASLLGPSRVETTIGGNKIVVEEQTNYPFENTFRFVVTASAAVQLRIRKPEWATSVKVSAEHTVSDGFIVIDKTWSGTETVDVSFDTNVQVRDDINGEKYFTWGALVLSIPIEGVEEETKSWPVPGFYNLKYAPKKLVVYEYTRNPVAIDASTLTFTTSLYNPETKITEPVKLVPMGQTILRQVTFKPSGK
ncbi:MAG: glycoside hydrolase family 127 protein [Cyclobacteriaceae bacterium]|nr:glycoside hydrolase family 127 protein [Cyclobacteriaceae bacterium]